jgi:sulfoxide reductase heme-binding subunit YedZ
MDSTNKSEKKKRSRKRLLRHQLPLFFISLGAVLLIIAFRKSPDLISNISISTAYTGLALLAATLAISPLQKILNRPNPVSTDFRRDLGFWAAVVSLAHVVFGLQVHMRGRMWLLFLDKGMDFPYLRFDLFGAANYSGLIAAFILAMLFAISNDRALNALGWKKWRRLQRWNYALFILVILHGVLYQVIEKRVPPYTYIFAAIGLIVVIIRLAGFLSRKRERA